MKKEVVFLIVVGCLGWMIGGLLNNYSADKKALEVINVGRLINFFCWQQQDGEKCLIVGLETLITDNQYYISTIIAERNYVSVEISKVERVKDGGWIVKEFFNRDFDLFPAQWKEIVQDKIKNHLGLAQNRGI